MNKIILCGNLTRDPEITTTSGGKTLCKFAIAVSRNNFEEGVDFFDVVAWGVQAENIGKYFFKGKKILIEGRVKIDVVDDEDTGKKRKFISIVLSGFEFVDSKRKEDEEGDEEEDSKPAKKSYSSSKSKSGDSGEARKPFKPEEDEGLPF